MVRMIAGGAVFTFMLSACGGSDDDVKLDHPEQTHSDGNAGDGGSDDGDTDDSGTGSGDDGGTGSGSGSGSGSGDSGSGDESGTPAFFPQVGAWTITGATTESDTCECDDLDDGSGDGTAPFTIEAVSDSVFTLSVDGGDALPCTLTDQAFICDTSDEATPVDDFDITIHTSTVISGTFADETSMIGTFDIGVSCSGSDCGWVSWVCDGTMPCEILSSFDASAD